MNVRKYKFYKAIKVSELQVSDIYIYVLHCVTIVGEYSPASIYAWSNPLSFTYVPNAASAQWSILTQIEPVSDPKLHRKPQKWNAHTKSSNYSCITWDYKLYSRNTTFHFSPTAILSAILTLFDPVPDPKLQ
jgi:hypothetical protein